MKKGSDKFLMGVCSGFAEYFNVDITLMRFIWLLSFFILGGYTFIIYFILGLIMEN